MAPSDSHPLASSSTSWWQTSPPSPNQRLIVGTLGAISDWFRGLCCFGCGTIAILGPHRCGRIWCRHRAACTAATPPTVTSAYREKFGYSQSSWLRGPSQDPKSGGNHCDRSWSGMATHGIGYIGLGIGIMIGQLFTGFVALARNLSVTPTGRLTFSLFMHRNPKMH